MAEKSKYEYDRVAFYDGRAKEQFLVCIRAAVDSNTLDYLLTRLQFYADAETNPFMSRKPVEPGLVQRRVLLMYPMGFGNPLPFPVIEWQTQRRILSISDFEGALDWHIILYGGLLFRDGVWESHT